MKGEKLPRYSLLVTFDDGYKSNVELLPVLDRYKCIPIVYVCSAIAGTNHPFWDKMVARKDIPFYKSISNKERLRILQEKELYTPDMVLEEAQALTFKNIAALKGRVTFGSHTRTHGILTRSTNEEQEDEIITSKKELEKICGEPVVHFSYPNGDYNRYSLECVKKAGYLTSRTVKPGWNDAKTDMFQLKQCMISDDADVNILRLQMSGIPGIIRFVRKPGRLSYKSHNFSG
jgi:peptidoglycan/xylan/chitin deacetylase (PgdA/CDA1 family)